MTEIPQVYFKKQDDSETEIEVFTMKELFQRSVKLNHQLKNHHRVDFYHLILITRGQGRHFVDFFPYQYQPGTLLLVARGQVQSFEISLSNDALIVIFTEEFIAKNLSHPEMLLVFSSLISSMGSPIIEFSEETGKSILNLILTLRNEYNSRDMWGRGIVLNLLLKVIMVKIGQRLRKEHAGGIKIESIRIFSRLQQLVTAKYSETRNAAYYAAELGVPYAKLNSICKEYTGKSIKQFIDFYITLELKRFLATSNHSINQLAYEMGFDEPTNMIKYFKQHTGFTPKQYRHSLKKNL